MSAISTSSAVWLSLTEYLALQKVKGNIPYPEMIVTFIGKEVRSLLLLLIVIIQVLMISFSVAEWYKLLL